MNNEVKEVPLYNELKSFFANLTTSYGPGNTNFEQTFEWVKNTRKERFGTENVNVNALLHDTLELMIVTNVDFGPFMPNAFSDGEDLGIDFRWDYASELADKILNREIKDLSELKKTADKGILDFFDENIIPEKDFELNKVSDDYLIKLCKNRLENAVNLITGKYRNYCENNNLDNFHELQNDLNEYAAIRFSSNGNIGEHVKSVLEDIRENWDNYGSMTTVESFLDDTETVEINYSNEDLVVLSKALAVINHGIDGLKISVPSAEDFEMLKKENIDFETIITGAGNVPEASDFLGDIEKMIDFASLEKDEFLSSYSYITDEEYKATENALSERGMTAEEYLQTIDEYRSFDLKNTFEKLGINDNVEHNTQGNELSIELGNGIELVASEKNTDGVFMYHDLKVNGELVICDGEYNRCIKGTDGNWHVFSNDDDNVEVFDIPDDVFNKLDSSLTYGYKKEIIDSCYEQYKSYLNVYGTKDDVVSRETFEKDIFSKKNNMTEYLQGNPVLLEIYRNKSERILYEKNESSASVQTVTENALQISVNDSSSPVSVTPDMAEEKASIHRMFDDFFTSAFKGATENDPRCLNDIVKHIIIPAGNKNDLNTGTATFWRKACDHAANSGGWLFAGGNYELMQRLAKYKLLDEKILALDSDDPRFEKVHDKAYDKWGSYLKEYLMDTGAINDSLSRRLVNNGVDPVKVAGEKFMKQMEEVLPKYKNNPLAAMDFIFKDMDHAKFSLIKQYIKEQSNGNATKYFTEKFDLSAPENNRNKSSDRASSGIGR